MSRAQGRAAPMAPDDRRSAIVDAVIPLLIQRGAGVTTRQIAEAAGVAEGTIYRAFPDKCTLMHAAARATMDPSRSGRALTGIDPALDLHETVRRIAEHLLERMENVLAVMMAIRGLGPRATTDSAEQPTGSPREGSTAGPPTGPPAFVTEANRALLATVTAVLERHREQLDVSPERAALLLRSLVFGSRHPGMDDVSALTAEEIATALVAGIARTKRR